MKEFQLIEGFFSGRGPRRRDVLLSIGDDCALVQPATNKAIAISVDTLVENVHFLPDMPAELLGYKALAVNLSDLASAGAEPAWMTLALTLPEVDETWLTDFSKGLFDAADYYNIALVGGDTTRGPKSITITVNGQIPEGKALTRSGARIGDWLYVTGTLGDSALGLNILRGQVSNVRADFKDYLVNRHYRPTPRVLAGQSIRGLASSCIDLSDGLMSDINHIMKASTIGAVIHVDKLPLSSAMFETLTLDDALSYALTGGEDYELMFSVPDSNKGALEAALEHTGVQFSQVGQVVGGNELSLKYNNQKFTPKNLGFKHFE